MGDTASVYVVLPIFVGRGDSFTGGVGCGLTPLLARIQPRFFTGGIMRGFGIKDLPSVQRVSGGGQIEAILEVVDDLLVRVVVQEDSIRKLQIKAKKIEGKYRGLKKLLDGPEST